MYIKDKKILNKNEVQTSDNIERIYKDCKFYSFGIDGEVEAIFIDCNFEKIKIYFGFFNMCTFLNVVFENCEFEGASFMECTFLKCSFVNCILKNDQLGGHTKFERSLILFTSFENCNLDLVEYVDTKIISE